MEYLLVNLLKSSLVGTGITVLLLAFAWIFRNRIPPVWIHILLLLAVVRFLIFFPLPSSPLSWERLLPVAEVEPQFETKSSSLPDRLKKPSQQTFPEAIDPVPFNYTNEAPKQSIEWNWKQVIFLIWLSGFAVSVSTIIYGVSQYRRILKSATIPDEDHRIVKLLEKAIATAGIKQTPKLAFYDLIETPAIGGLFRPVILAPQSSLNYLKDAEIESVLLHELGHLRRRDLLINLLLILTQSLHWFNPFVWYLCHRVRMVAERATDEWVMKKMDRESRKVYGHALLNLLENTSSNSPQTALMVGVAENKRELEQRILAISRFRSKRSWLATTGCLISFSLVAGIGLTQAPDSKADKSDPVETSMRVVRIDGTPVPNAAVKVYNLSRASNRLEALVQKVDADTAGLFTIHTKSKTDIPFFILAESPDGEFIGGEFIGGGMMSNGHGPHYLRNGSDVTLHSIQIQKIKIVEANDKPIKNLNLTAVCLLLNESGVSKVIMQKFKTDSRGQAKFKIPKGFVFALNHDRLNLSIAENFGKDGSLRKANPNEEFVFQLAPAAIIKGRVTTVDGKPIEGVYISNGTGLLTSASSAETDKYGFYQLGQLRPDYRHHFTARMPINSDPDWCFDDKIIDIPKGALTVDHDFQPVKGNTADINYINSQTNNVIETQTVRGIQPSSHLLHRNRMTIPTGFQQPDRYEFYLNFKGKTHTTLDVKLVPNDTTFAPNSDWQFICSTSIRDGRKFTFEGNVEAKNSDYTLTCDKLVMQLDEKDEVVDWTASGKSIQIHRVTKDSEAQTVSGRRATYNRKTAEISISGSPLPKNEGSFRHYYGGPPRMKVGDAHLHLNSEKNGIKLLPNGKYRVTGPRESRAIVVVPAEGTAEWIVSSDFQTMQKNPSILILKGEVKTKHPDYDFTCDTLEIFLDEKNRVKQWTATGKPVQIDRVNKAGEKQIVKGRQATYDGRTHQISVAGRPASIQNGETLTEAKSEAVVIKLGSDGEYTLSKPTE